MTVFHISWNVPESLFHEILRKKSFTMYPCLKIYRFQVLQKITFHFNRRSNHHARKRINISSYWSYIGVKYLQHFHLVAINKWQWYNTAAKLFGIIQYILVKIPHHFLIHSRRIPANICWSSIHFFKRSSSRHHLQDVFKTSSSRGLQRNNFSSSKTSWKRLGRRKIVTLNTSWRRLEDMSWRRLVLKTFSRHVFKTSSRRLQDKQNVYLKYLYLKNLNLYLKNLYLTYLYLTNQGESKMY